MRSSRRSKGNSGASRVAKTNSNIPRESYSRFPTSVRLGGGTPTERKQASETVSRFMKNAKAGDVYSIGGSFGDTGGQRFEVVQKGGSKLALKWQNTNRNAVKFDKSNVKKFISNGAVLVSRK